MSRIKDFRCCRFFQVKMFQSFRIPLWCLFFFLCFPLFRCSASAKTAAVWIGGELNCFMRAPSWLSSFSDNEMTINRKAAPSRSFVHLQVEQQCWKGVGAAGRPDYGGSPTVIRSHRTMERDVANACKIIPVWRSADVVLKLISALRAGEEGTSGSHVWSSCCFCSAAKVRISISLMFSSLFFSL